MITAISTSESSFCSKNLSPPIFSAQRKPFRCHSIYRTRLFICNNFFLLFFPEETEELYRPRWPIISSINRCERSRGVARHFSPIKVFTGEEEKKRNKRDETTPTVVFHPGFGSTALRQKWHLQYSPTTLPSFVRSFYHHSPFPVLIIISYVAREGSCANNKRYIHVCIFGSGPIPILELSTKPEILLRTSLHTEERDQKSPWRWLRKWNRFSAHIIGSRFDWAPLWE